MRQRLNNVLAINLACSDALTTGDIVEIIGDLSVAVSTSAASVNIIGIVARKQGYLESNANNAWPIPNGGVSGGDPAECTIETRFNKRRDDRISGMAMPVGPFIMGGDGLAYPYLQGSPAKITGTTSGNLTFVVSVSDAVAISVGRGVTQAFTMVSSGAQTMAQVAATINATANGFIASVNATGNLVLTCNDIKDSLAVVAATDDAYTLLGLTVASVNATASNYDAAAIQGIAITSAGAAGATIQTLEY